MKKLLLALLAVAMALAISPAALADTFLFNIASPTLDAYLTITATHGPTYDVVTGVSGTVWESAFATATPTTGPFTVVPDASAATIDPLTGAAISSAPGSACAAGGQGPSPECSINGAFYYDNLILPANTPGPGSVDWGGLLFGTSDGFELNIFSSGDSDDGAWYWADNRGGHSNNLVTDLDDGDGLTTTPEPGSLFLLGTGLLGLAVILFRRAKPSRQNFLA